VSTATAEMLKVKRERRFPTPRSLEPDIPPALEAILFKCLEPSPQDRYPTAADLAAELRGVLATLTGQPGPGQGLRGRIHTWFRGRRPALAMLAAAVCLTGTLPTLGGYLKRQRNQEDEVVQTIALQASSLEQSIRNERMLAVHDLRPADARTRERMAALRAKAAPLGPVAEGQVSFAVGRAHFLLQDLPQAKAELEKAWSAGFQTPDTAFLLAQVHAREYQALVQEAAFMGQAPPPRATRELAQAGRFLQQARMQTGHPQEYIEAVEAELRGDQPLAVEKARKALEANPWHLESAALGSQALARMAKERLDSGDANGAEARYQEALDLAQAALQRAQSEPRLHHAACAAALGLATVAMENGGLALRGLEGLERQADQALALDAENQDAQSDWLQVRTLKALCLWGRGQDPRPVLDQALQFYWGRTREPRSAELRTDHLILYWLQAERDFAKGEAPSPSLTEALKDPGHTVTRSRDFQGDLLNFKARLEASRGQDPRPTVETVAARFEATAREQGNCGLCEIAAKAWLIRAEWEHRREIDPSDSLRHDQALLNLALESRPTSASAHALNGLCQVLEAKSRPENRKLLISRANEHLRWSIRLNPAEREAIRLRTALARP